MILFDTDVLIYGFERESPHYGWARETIAEAVAGGGGCINAVSLAEGCVGDGEPESVAQRVRSWGVQILDVPVAAAEVCSQAYLLYRERRRSESDEESPRVPLPDFFIGAHAQIMGWPLATADTRRFTTYFPDVELRTP